MLTMPVAVFGPIDHRTCFCVAHRAGNSSWRQTAKMTLAHSRYADLFENGYDQLLKTGYWRLKNMSRDAIEQLTSNVSPSGRATPQFGLPVPASPKTESPKPTSHGHSTSHIRGANGEEHMSLLASLAVAEGAEELTTISSLSALSSATKRSSDSSPILHKSNASHNEDLDEFGQQHAADRRRSLSQHFRAPNPVPSDATHQLRKEYQLLEAKYKSLELEHRSALMQLEKFSALLLASRRQHENACVQAELQDGQVRALLDKVQRLEYEIHQRNASAMSAPPNCAATSATVTAHGPTHSPQGLPALLGSPGASNALTAMMSMPKLGLLNQPPSGFQALYGGTTALPWLAAATPLHPMGWTFDMNNHAAKLELHTLQTQSQAQTQTHALQTLENVKTETASPAPKQASTSPTTAT